MKKALLLLCLLAAHAALAAELVVVHNKAEPPYFVELLKDALEHTKDMGPYVLKPSDASFAGSRLIDEVADDAGHLDIMTRGSNIEEERRLLPIRIPLDKGLLGYRIMLVRKQDLARFAAIQSLDDLKRVRTGQGALWPDTKILEGAGFKVIKGTFSPGLTRMLNEERFDMFPRAPWEAETDLKRYAAEMPDLVIEPSFVLVYPYPRYFMVSRKGKGPELAARIETGLRRMIADGSFDRHFDGYFGPFIEKTALRQRRVFQVDNKLLPPETPFGDKKLWFNMSAAETAPAAKR